MIEKIRFIKSERSEWFFKRNKPDIVIHAAGKVEEYHNKTYPAEFIFQNSQMALNIINSLLFIK